MSDLDQSSRKPRLAALRSYVRATAEFPGNLLGKTYTRRRSLAVVGNAEAGKTVFLTSLVNHLLNHNPKLFQLDDRNTRICNSKKRHAASVDGWREFPYLEYRTAIAEQGTWPVKTTACSEFQLDFSTAPWGHRYQLTLYDVPGERFSDAGMVKADYAAWSRDQIEHLRMARAGRAGANGGMRRVAEYLRLADSETEVAASEAELIVAYKRALIDLRDNYFCQISPSTFRIGVDVKNGSRLTLKDDVQAVLTEHHGRVPDDLDERIVATRRVGLAEQEFCPLGDVWRTSDPLLIDCFEQRYQTYRSKVVLPLFGKLAQCEGVVALFDVMDVLGAGPRHLNESQLFSEQLHKAFEPDKGVLTMAAKLLGIARHTSRIAVVASQCDRCHPEDWDYLKNFVNSLYAQPFRDASLPCEAFTCAAVKSTGDVDEKQLCGRLACSDDESAEAAWPKVVYGVSRIPNRFVDLMNDFDRPPDDWNPSEFLGFPRVQPEFPEVHCSAPFHKDLDAVFGWTTGWWPKAGRSVQR